MKTLLDVTDEKGIRIHAQIDDSIPEIETPEREEYDKKFCEGLTQAISEVLIEVFEEAGIKRTEITRKMAIGLLESTGLVAEAEEEDCEEI